MQPINIIKILAIADQGPQESIRAMAEKEKIDLICTLGDLDMFEIKELELKV